MENKIALSGPMFEPSKSKYWASVLDDRGGAHYNIFSFSEETEMEALRSFFPEGEADYMNFVLFSTSGIHGSYTTIEEIETSLKKYGEKHFEGDEYPDDWSPNNLTVLIVQPRIVCMRYGTVKVTLEDIDFLKKLRASSWKAVKTIGR